ncbi:MAG: GumC family protein, partial [Gammaproteobacteria bacterium]|nr:GumC family protein [Gammaproteobacteria bacterium]
MNVPSAPAATDVEIDVRALFMSLVKALPFILLFLLVVGGGTFFLLSSMTPVYQSETTVLIEAGESDLTRSTSTAETAAVLDREAVTSQVQLIRSGDLAKIVASKLDLEAQPEYQKAIKNESFLDTLLVDFGLAQSPSGTSVEERVLREYYDNLEVRAIEDSRVISIAFSSTDPQLAARGANMIAAEYLALQKAAKRDTNEDATQWLESEISDLRQKVAASEAAVTNFRSENDLFTTSGGDTPTTLNQQTLTDLNAERVQLAAAKADAQTKATQIRASLKSGTVPNITEVLNSQLIQRLVEQQVNLRAQIAELSATLLPGHPRMRELNAQLADLNRQVTAEAE